MKNRLLIYWLCQIFGWGLYLAFLVGMLVVFGGEEQLTTSNLLLQVIIYFTLVVSSDLFRLSVKRLKWLELKAWSIVPRAIIGTLITAVIVQSIIHILIYHLIQLEGIMPFSWSAFVGYIFNVFLALTLWSAIYFAIKFIQKQRKTEIEKLELTTALQEAELAVLKNQINPHFLFNALNNIRALILSEPEKARKMVTHISDLLRYSIQFNAAEKVSLKEEIEIVKDYLFLEEIQFNERLKYTIEVDPETEAFEIPPMAIQILVENAIKHGLSIQKQGGEISIVTAKIDGFLSISVSNTGQLSSNNKREGIGIKNLMERMKILFGEFAEFELSNVDQNSVEAKLKIPLS